MKIYLNIILLLMLLSYPKGMSGQNASIQTENRAFKEDKWQEVTKAVDYHKVQKRSVLVQEIKKIGYEDLVEDNNLKPKEKPNNKNFNYDWSGLTSIGYILLAIIGGFLIYFFVSNSTWKSDKKIDDLQSVLAEIEDNLPEADIETPLDRAKKEKNYKVATRLYYLLVLQKMSDKKYIKWSKEKTNRNYISELRGQKFIEQFRQVTALYEKAWFGKEIVQQTEFDSNEPFFIGLIQKIG